MIENGTKIIDNRLKDMIKTHEGLRLKPYKCPAGKLTIGFGRNLDANGISEEEADFLLQNDIRIAKQVAYDFVEGWHWPQLNEARQAVVIDMAFNLGPTKLNEFKGFRKALQEERWQGAAIHMRSSLWYVQVKKRAKKLTKMMETGEWN